MYIFLSMAIGKISTGLEEGFMLSNSCMEIGEKQSKIDGRIGSAEKGVEEGMMLALTSLILPIRKERKLLQSF